jgi:hypothetical protein
MMMRNAVTPLAAMLASIAAGALGPMETNSTRPVAALNRKKPGINETTAEKATAAKQRCRRSTTGVARTLASMQATSAEVGALPPGEGDPRPTRGMCEHADCDRERQQPPWHGEESAKEATAHPAAITSMTNGTGGDASAIARFAPPPQTRTGRRRAYQEHDDAGIGQARVSQRRSKFVNCVARSNNQYIAHFPSGRSIFRDPRLQRACPCRTQIFHEPSPTHVRNRISRRIP